MEEIEEVTIIQCKNSRMFCVTSLGFLKIFLDNCL